MQLSLIACPFKTSYGAASESLIKALEKKTASKVQWVASNCGCGDDVRNRPAVPNAGLQVLRHDHHHRPSFA